LLYLTLLLRFTVVFSCYDFDGTGKLNMVEVSLLIEYTLVGYCKLTGLPCPNELHIDKFTEELFENAKSEDSLPGVIGVNDCEYAYQLSRCLTCMPFTKQVLKMDGAIAWLHLDTPPPPSSDELGVEEAPVMSSAKTVTDIENENEIAAFENENIHAEVSLAEMEAEIYQSGPLVVEAPVLEMPAETAPPAPTALSSPERRKIISDIDRAIEAETNGEECPVSALSTVDDSASPKEAALLRRKSQMAAAPMQSEVREYLGASYARTEERVSSGTRSYLQSSYAATEVRAERSEYLKSSYVAAEARAETSEYLKSSYVAAEARAETAEYKESAYVAAETRAHTRNYLQSSYAAAEARNELQAMIFFANDGYSPKENAMRRRKSQMAGASGSAAVAPDVRSYLSTTYAKVEERAMATTRYLQSSYAAAATRASNKDAKKAAAKESASNAGSSGDCGDMFSMEVESGGDQSAPPPAAASVTETSGNASPKENAMRRRKSQMAGASGSAAVAPDVRSYLSTTYAKVEERATATTRYLQSSYAAAEARNELQAMIFFANDGYSPKEAALLRRKSQMAAAPPMQSEVREYLGASYARTEERVSSGTRSYLQSSYAAAEVRAETSKYTESSYVAAEARAETTEYLQSFYAAGAARAERSEYLKSSYVAAEARAETAEYKESSYVAAATREGRSAYLQSSYAAAEARAESSAYLKASYVAAEARADTKTYLRTSYAAASSRAGGGVSGVSGASPKEAAIRRRGYQMQGASSSTTTISSSSDIPSSPTSVAAPDALSTPKDKAILRRKSQMAATPLAQTPKDGAMLRRAYQLK
jgi:hypothetical protein